MSVRGRGGQRGQALTELALSSLFLILILFGAVDFARVYNADTALQEAARVGARHGALYDPNSNRDPFLCDTSTVSGCPASTNTYTSGDGIKQVVDKILAGAGLPASTLEANASCVGGTSPFNGPFTTQFANDVGANYNHPYLYLCYDTSSGSPGTRPTPPGKCASTGCVEHDLEVVVLMKLSLVITGEFGPALSIVGYSHMATQGT